jgi:hypothetical protein
MDKNISESFVSEKIISFHEFVDAIKGEEYFICKYGNDGDYQMLSNRSKIKGDGFWFEYNMYFERRDNQNVEYWNGWFKLKIQHEKEEPVVNYVKDDGEIVYKTYYDGYADHIETEGTGEYYFSNYYISTLRLTKLL